MWPFSKRKSQQELDLEQLLKQKDDVLGEANAKLEAVASESKRLCDELGIAQRSIVNYERENRALKGDYKVLEAEKSCLDSKSKVDDNEAKQLKEQLNNSAKEHDKTKSKLEIQLKAQEIKYQDEICGIEKEYQDKIDELGKQQDELKNQLGGLAAQLRQASEERQKAYNKQDDANQKAAKLKTDYEKKERAFIRQLDGVQKITSQKEKELAKQKALYALALDTFVKVREVLPNWITDQELAQIASYLPTLSAGDATEILTQLLASASANDRNGLISKLKRYSP